MIKLIKSLNLSILVLIVLGLIAALCLLGVGIKCSQAKEGTAQYCVCYHNHLLTKEEK